MAASHSSATLERLSGLLNNVESSAKALLEFLCNHELESAKDSDDYSTRVAQNLGLPFHSDPEIAVQASALRIASEQLSRLVTPPRHVVFEAAGSFYTTKALQIVIKHDIATIIDAASKGSGKSGKEGVSASQLAQKCKLEVDLLARILRYLSQRGIFQELETGIFANTAASATLIDAPEFRAHLDLVIHEGQLAVPFLEQFMEQRFASAQEGNPTVPGQQPMSAFALFSGGSPVYEWLHLPANIERGKNFNLAMRGMNRTEGVDFIPVDYPFSSLADGTVLVDVGGGIGSLPELLLPVVPNLQFVVQDLEPVVKLANEVASPNMKKWVAEGRVKFQVHDFFTLQPADLQGAVFVLKNVIHNYPNPKATEILKAIRVAQPARILIIDRLVAPLLRTELTDGEQDSGLHAPENTAGSVKLPISSQGIPTMYDLIMGSLHGGKNRRLDEWKELLQDGGFQLVNVYPLRASTGQGVLEAVVI